MINIKQKEARTYLPKLAIAFATVALCVGAFAATPAQAADNWRNNRDGHDGHWDNRGGYHREWRSNNDWRYRRPAPVRYYYSPPPRVYYAPPPVYYAPPPRSPGFSLILPIHIR
jgi:hypothetical protein